MDAITLTNRSAPDRFLSDYYPTPANVTIALLDYLQLPLSTVIWEPACGEGHMSRAIESRNYSVISTELEDRGYGATGIDYLTAELQPCDWIITNPPFCLAEEFIRRSIQHNKPFALLLKSQCWHAAGKKKIFDAYRPEAVLPLTWRPNFLFAQQERKNGSPTMECIWTVWGRTPAKYTIYQPLSRPKESHCKAN